MPPSVSLRVASSRRRFVRQGAFDRLAARICDGEEVSGNVEIGVLLCDDDLITELNRKYRRKNAPTDVLSFEQGETAPPDGPRPLGDIAISLETAERNCGGDRALMRREIDLLFCHGLLHLLGYDHGTRSEKEEMQRKQAEYLGTSQSAAWRFGPKPPAARAARPAIFAEGSRPIGRGK